MTLDPVTPLLGAYEARRHERHARRETQEQLYLRLQDVIFKITADLNKLRATQLLHKGGLTQFTAFPHLLRSVDSLYDDLSLLASAVGHLRLAGCPAITWDAACDLSDAAVKFAEIVNRPPFWRPSQRAVNEQQWYRASDDLGRAMTAWVEAVQYERDGPKFLRRLARRSVGRGRGRIPGRMKATESPTGLDFAHG